LAKILQGAQQGTRRLTANAEPDMFFTRMKRRKSMALCDMLQRTSQPAVPSRLFEAAASGGGRGAARRSRHWQYLAGSNNDGWQYFAECPAIRISPNGAKHRKCFYLLVFIARRDFSRIFAMWHDLRVSAYVRRS
jgi:hypothetical protein